MKVSEQLKRCCSASVNSIDRLGNRVDPALLGVTPAPEQTAAHQELFVADFHPDRLLWGRDILVRSEFGHLDVPRLRDGNVSLQVFTVATKAPPKNSVSEGEITCCVSPEAPNLAGILTALELRPLKTWFDREARALLG